MSAGRRAADGPSVDVVAVTGAGVSSAGSMERAGVEAGGCAAVRGPVGASPGPGEAGRADGGGGSSCYGGRGPDAGSGACVVRVDHVEMRMKWAICTSRDGVAGEPAGREWQPRCICGARSASAGSPSETGRLGVLVTEKALGELLAPAACHQTMVSEGHVPSGIGAAMSEPPDCAAGGLGAGKLVDGRELDLAITRHAGYVGCSGVVTELAANARLPLVACCCAGGEVLVWAGPDILCGSGVLRCVGLVQGGYKHVAWGGWWDTGGAAWDSSVLWTLAKDGLSLTAFSIWKCDVLAPADLTPCYSFRLSCDDLVPIPPGVAAETALCVLPDQSHDSAVIKQVVVVVSAGLLHAVRVSVGPDALGHPAILDHAAVGRVPLDGAPPCCISAVDPLDWSLRSRAAFCPLLLSVHRGVVLRYEILKDFIAVSKEEIFSTDASMLQPFNAPLQVVSVSGGELFVRVMDLDSAEADSAVGYILECSKGGVKVAGETMRAEGHMATVLSARKWKLRSKVPMHLSRLGAVATFFPGDGNVLLAIMNDDRIFILSPLPSSRTAGIYDTEWADLVDHGRTIPAWGAASKRTHEQAQESQQTSMIESSLQRPPGRWICIREGQIPVSISSESNAGDEIWRHPEPGMCDVDSNICAAQLRLGQQGRVAWCSEGSVVCAGRDGGLYVVTAGIADGGAALHAPNMRQSSGAGQAPRPGAHTAAGAAAPETKEAGRRTQKAGQPVAALWNMVDLARTGPSSVYYHPTVLEHALLLGNLLEIEERLTALLAELRDGFASPGYSRPRLSRPRLSRSTASGKASASPVQVAGRASVSDPADPARSGSKSEGSASTETECNPATAASNSKALESVTAKSNSCSFERLKGSDLGPLKRLAGMKLADTSKLGPASVLISRQPALLTLLPDEGRDVWDEHAAKLTRAPDWSALLQAIEQAESALASHVSRPESPSGTAPAAEDTQRVSGSGGEGFPAGEGASLVGEDTSAADAAATAAAMKEVASRLGSILAGLDRAPRGAWALGSEGGACEAGRVVCGVGRWDLMRLIAVAEGIREAHEQRVIAELDEAGLIFWVVCHVWGHLFALSRHGHGHPSGDEGPAASAPAINGHAVCFGLHSDGQDVLVKSLPDDKEAMEALWVPLWLDSTPQLRAYAERVGRRVFMDRQDPMEAMLYYVLARKISLLQALFKKAGQEKVSQFLQRDFVGDEKARAAARSNGYTLVGKGQHEAAAAFFVLAGAAQHALDLAAINLARPMLALLIARLAPATASEEPAGAAGAESALVQRTLEQVVMPHATARNDRGAMHAVKWRLDELVPAYSVLWSTAAAAADARPLKAAGNAGSGNVLGGLLGRRFAEEDADDSCREDAAEHEVEEGVHACTAALLLLVSKRPRMRIALRMRAPPAVPWRQLALNATRELLLCGCGGLLISADLLGLVQSSAEGGIDQDGPSAETLTRDGHSAGRQCEWQGVVATRACLAWLADWIRGLSAEAWRRSPGDICPQPQLVTLHEEMERLAARYGVEEGAVVPLLCRFCHVRGLWRVEHALVTGHYGQAGRDASLAEVAVHPLTLSAVEGVSRFPRLLLVNWPLLSRMERTGKVLQLVLHSLTVDNSGSTGALATLAASVMTVHFLLAWARSDAAELERLLLRNEGAEDQDSAMALAWLMEACDPDHFAVGGSGPARREGCGRSASCGGEVRGGGGESGRGSAGTSGGGGGGSPRRGGDESQTAAGPADSHEDAAPVECADAAVAPGVVARAVRAKCLRWLAASRFHARLAMALSGPQPEPGPRETSLPVHTAPSLPPSCTAGGLRHILPPPPPATAPVEEPPSVPAHVAGPPGADPCHRMDDSAGSAGPPASPGLRLFSQVKKWAGKRSGSLDRIQDHLKNAALRALHASPLHPSHSTPSLPSASHSTPKSPAATARPGTRSTGSLDAATWEQCAASAPAAAASKEASGRLRPCGLGRSWHEEGGQAEAAAGGWGRDGRRRTACGLECLSEQSGAAGSFDESPSPSDGGAARAPWLHAESFYSQSSLKGLGMSSAFFVSEPGASAAGPAARWQVEAPERLGNGLLDALVAWTRGLRRELEKEVTAAVCEAGGGTGMAGPGQGLAAKSGGEAAEAERERGRCDGPEWTRLWEHYQGQEHLNRVIWRALAGDPDGPSGSRSRPEPTLAEGWSLHERRNAVLDQLQYPGRYVGRLDVSAVRADCIRPPPSGLLLLGHAVKTASILSVQPVAAWAGAGGGPVRASGLDRVALQTGSRAGEFRPTTQVCFRLECSGGPDGPAGVWQSARHKSAWARNSTSPRYDVRRTLRLPRQQCSRQELKLELVEKHNFGEDLIAAGTLDVSRLPCSARPVSVGVAMSRPDGGGGDDGHVCSLELELCAWYQLDEDEDGGSGAGHDARAEAGGRAPAGLLWY